MMLVMDAAMAAALRDATAGRAQRLDPRPIAAGPFAGSEALPAAVLAEPEFAALLPILAELQMPAFDVGEAWPPAEA